MRKVAILLAALALAPGCVRQQRFRFVPATTGCFPETMNQPVVAGPPDQRPSLDCRRSQYKAAFIEFDQDGKMFDPNQEAAAFKLLELEKARAAEGKVITVVYIHGWKNNAAEAAPGGEPKDAAKFQDALLELGYRAGKAVPLGTPPVPIVGIYLAWRGKTLMGPSWFTFTSLWSRRNTANNIGDGPDLGGILNRIIDRTNAGNDKSRVLLIGHSFGARVLEHAIESKKVELYQAPAGQTVVQPRVDLVLYVNSANDSRLSMARVQALQAARLQVRHPDFDPAECAGAPKPPETPVVHAAHCRDYPLMVAITSKGDSATKYLLPLADTVNGDRLKPELAATLPPLPATGTFADPLPSAGAVRKMAAGHFGFLQSHVAHEIICPAIPSASQRDQVGTEEVTLEEAVRKAVAEALGKTGDEAGRLEKEAAAADAQKAEDQARYDRAMHPVCSVDDENCRFVFRTLGDQPACYQVDARQAVENRPPFNRTPFWIMDVEPTVIKDHGDIWNVSFVEMLGQLMAPRGFFEPRAARIQIRADGASK